MIGGLLTGAVLLVVVAWLAACAEAGLARVSSFRAEGAVRAAGAAAPSWPRSPRTPRATSTSRCWSGSPARWPPPPS
ncbi:hypothetical protein ACFQVA_11225 [Actinomadura keratinilytica]